jgi:hypothetical protein
MANDESNSQTISPGEAPNFKEVYKSLLALMQSTPEDQRFPQKKLRNRLINLGLQEFLDGIRVNDSLQRFFEVGGQQCYSGTALEVFGFPFKFTSQWDEATLALGHFLDRFRQEENTKLEVCALHLLSKGEDKTLSDWQSAKAKFYLELQNMILLLNGIGGRQSRVRRIFAFSDIADIAFLTQSAVSLLSEQMAAGIGVGLLFTNTFKEDGKIVPISNALMVSFQPNPSEESDHEFHFYSMYELLDDNKGHDLPYQERCITKWFRDPDHAFDSHKWIKQLFNLFPQTNWTKAENQWNKWPKPNYKSPTGVYSLEGSDVPTENQIFNSTVVMMARAFAQYGGAPINAFDNRINDTVVTGDWIRLQRAISAFDDAASLEIRAVDATSVKNSLTIHESDPTYRHWLRTSLSRVLRSSDESPKRLRRIYILDDSDPKAIREFRTLLREMQYYLDYFHYEIAGMSDLIQADQFQPKNKQGAKTSESITERWTKFKDRVYVNVTTTTILAQLASSHVNRDLLEEIVSSDSILDPLLNVDFISSSGKEAGKGMIYNFLNQRADPGELQFAAFLFRSPFNAVHEEKIIFGYLDDLAGDLRALQLQYRMRSLAKSIRDYEKEYGRILNAQINDYLNDNQSVIIDLKNVLLEGGTFDEAKRTTFIDIRAAFETALYQYFEKRFSYLYCFLDHYSLKVDFFGSSVKRKIKQIDPFIGCENADTLTDRIKQSVEAKGEPPTFEEVQEGWDCHDVQRF